MAKKKATNQPIVAEEPARSEEPLRFDDVPSAEPSTRRSGERSSERNRSTNPYQARSARERRAERSARTGTTPRRERKHEELSQQVIAELLDHPTKTVTQDELRKEYGYVIADLRSMGALAAALIVALVVLAQILPK
jgi:hypothetical protein